MHIYVSHVGEFCLCQSRSSLRSRSALHAIVDSALLSRFVSFKQCRVLPQLLLISNMFSLRSLSLLEAFLSPREVSRKHQEPPIASIDVYPTAAHTDMSVCVNEVRNIWGAVGGSPRWWLIFLCVCVGESDRCTMSFLWWLHWQHMGSLKGVRKRERESGGKIPSWVFTV